MNDQLIDLDAAIGLAEAAKRIRGRGGKPSNVATVRRWANPKRGCYPAGPEGPQLLLRTVRVSNELLTMPDWVAAFEAERVRLGSRQPADTSRREASPRRRAIEDRTADEVLARGGVLP